MRPRIQWFPCWVTHWFKSVFYRKKPQRFRSQVITLLIGKMCGSICGIKHFIYGDWKYTVLFKTFALMVTTCPVIIFFSLSLPLSLSQVETVLLSTYNICVGWGDNSYLVLRKTFKILLSRLVCVYPGRPPYTQPHMHTTAPEAKFWLDRRPSIFPHIFKLSFAY